MPAAFMVAQFVGMKRTQQTSYEWILADLARDSAPPRWYLGYRSANGCKYGAGDLEQFAAPPS